MLCVFCGKLILKERADKWHKLPRYCSTRCIKAAWYMKNAKPKNSVYLGNPQKGIVWEEWFIKKFGAKRPSVSLNTPFDFFWKGERIDLKTANKNKKGSWWSFGGWDKDCGKDCDFVLCLGLLNDRMQKVFKVPASVFGRGISVGCLTSPKYDKYLIEL